MNILHITTFLQGGAGQVIAELACSQVLLGHKVTVVASKTAEQDYFNYPQWLDQLRSMGVRLVLVESTFKRDIALNVSAFRQVQEFLDYAAPSIMHTHAAIPSLIALLLRSRAKSPIPILQTMHGWGIQKNPQQAAMDITILNQLDRVITPSESSKRLLSNFGLLPELIKVVPYGVARTPITNEPSSGLLKQWRASGLIILACIGSIGPRKNQRLLMHALAHPQAPRNLACAFVGEGKEIPVLQTMAAENGIGEQVHFFGYQPEAAKFISSADWLVLPSNDEGLPLSILEAYRAGVPVLGSNIPEIAEIILQEQTGILFQAGNEDSLVRALLKISSMPQKERAFMGVAANKLWQEKYSLDRMLDQYALIYQELLHKP
jgi:L-malate glycosyltransferase